MKQDVEADTASKTVTCKCRWHDEWKFPCFCAWGLIVQEQLDDKDPNWFGERCHISAMKEACACEPPAMALQDSLEAAMTMPPEHKALAGRPRKRKSRCQAKETANGIVHLHPLPK